VSAGSAAGTGLAPAVGVCVARALVWVEGPDAASFLQGLLSNDVAGLAEAQARPALLLDARGHVVVLMTVHRDHGDAFTLVTEPHLGGPLAQALERYHFSEDLELLGPEPTEALVLARPDAPSAAGADLVLPGTIPGTWEMIAAEPAALMEELRLAPADESLLEAARIRAGVPRIGTDTGPATLVQEAGLESIAVSFDKGCYLGQETVARAQFRGRVNRLPRLLNMAEAPGALPAPVVADGREVGRLTSVAPAPGGGFAGFAILRREVEPGARVGVGEGGTATAAMVEAVPATGG
jgi:tRNA-modifying protein YgfZ